MQTYNSSNVLQSHEHYTYDVYDRLIEKQVDPTGGGTYTTTQAFVYDSPPSQGGAGGGRVDLQGSGTLTDRIVSAPGDGALADENGSGVVSWYLADNEGTIRDVAQYNSGTNTTTIVDHLKYDAFGNITSQSNSAYQPLFAYAGQMWDATVCMYYDHARWFDPHTGRFMSQDPTGFGAGDMNLYRYVGNAPTLYIDPTGMREADANGNYDTTSPLNLAVGGIDNDLVSFMDGMVNNGDGSSEWQQGNQYVNYGGNTAFIHVYEPKAWWQLWGTGEFIGTVAYDRWDPESGDLAQQAARQMRILAGLNQIHDAVGLGLEGTKIAIRIANDPLDNMLSLREFIEQPNVANALGMLPFIPAPSSIKALTQAEQGAIRKIDNAIRDHLKPHDLIGSLRDAMGNPVPKRAGGFFDHLKEMNDTLRGLRNNAEKLKNSTDPAAQAAYQRALDSIREIEEHAKGVGI